jgi:hypothetical protein
LGERFASRAVTIVSSAKACLNVVVGKKTAQALYLLFDCFEGFEQGHRNLQPKM